MRKKDLLLLAAAFVVIAGVVAVVLTNNQSESTDTACTVTGQTHRVVIQNDTAQPTTITAKRCDELLITNHDNVTRLIGFGNHEHHVAYDGVTEKLLRQNESLQVTLGQVGEYHFHDHYHDEVEVEFTVNL